MSDYLMRNDAPLSDQEWARIDDLVIGVARELLVGRRFISLTGPLGAGYQAVLLPTVGGATTDSNVIQVTDRKFLPLPLIYQDFCLSWRDIEAGRQMGLPLELGPAAAASAICARREDELIFRGNAEHAGLLTAAGSHSVALANWDKPGEAFANIVAAVETLVTAGFYGPFAVVLSPALYAKTQRIVEGAGRLERKFIEDVAEGGLFHAPVLTGNEGLVVAQGAQNLDLVIAQDLVTAYLGPENMDHTFRVLESLALRIKQAGAICLLA